MSTSRSSKIEQLFKSLRKHYKTVPTTPDRSIVDHLVYACVVEDTTYEQADEAFAKLMQSYVDYNEIRVTTAVEIAELVNAGKAGIVCAQRLKRILQSVYETRYAFDIEDLKKGNLAKSLEFFNALKGMTPFVCNYINQNALGGHSIPLGNAEMEISTIVGLVTEAEAKKGLIPGLERAIAKSKGIEFSQLIHQFAIDFVTNPKSAAVAATFKELKVTYKPAPPVKEQPAAPVQTIVEGTPAKSPKGTAAKSAVAVKDAKEAPAKSKDAAKETTKPTKDLKEAKTAKEQKAPPKELVEEKPIKAAKPDKPSKPVKSAEEKPAETTKKESDPKSSKKVAPPTPAKATKEEKAGKALKPATKAAAKPPTKSKSAPPPATKDKKTPTKKPATTAGKKAAGKPSKTSQALTKKKPR